MPVFLKKIPTVAVLVGLLWIVACAHAAPRPDYRPLRSEVERLYLNYHELKAVHSDLHTTALMHTGRSDGQLNEIQAAARLIDQATLIAYDQWKLLSITEYIRDSARSDFFSLRVKDVAEAHRKSKSLVMTIKVYDAFIKDAVALTLIEKGIAHIERNMAIYEAMHALMMPLANRPGMMPDGGREVSL